VPVKKRVYTAWLSKSKSVTGLGTHVSLQAWSAVHAEAWKRGRRSKTLDWHKSDDVSRVHSDRLVRCDSWHQSKRIVRESATVATLGTDAVLLYY
jgi:hypothetical protein